MGLGIQGENMKVRELIRLLKKQNPDAAVLMQAHDQSEDESDGPVDFVSASDSELLQERYDGPVVLLS